MAVRFAVPNGFELNCMTNREVALYALSGVEVNWGGIVVKLCGRL